jgi:hypothetical protein
MRTLIFLSVFCNILLALHCYALHKRVAYFEKTCDREYARGMSDAFTAIKNGTAKAIEKAESK